MWNNFRDANEVLRGLGLTYWADCGTLLGLVREGDLLKHDLDVDFGVLGTEGHLRVVSWMNALGFKLYCTYGSVNNGYEQRFARGNSKVDVFYFYPLKDGRVWSGTWWRAKHLIVSEFDNYFTPTKGQDFKGERVFLPAQPEKALEARYGDWKTVQKKWRWFRDPLCIRPDTLPPLQEMEAWERKYG